MQLEITSERLWLQGRSGRKEENLKEINIGDSTEISAAAILLFTKNGYMEPTLAAAFDLSFV